jgi:hypothetical protein
LAEKLEDPTKKDDHLINVDLFRGFLELRVTTLFSVEIGESGVSEDFTALGAFDTL